MEPQGAEHLRSSFAECVFSTVSLSNPDPFQKADSPTDGHLTKPVLWQGDYGETLQSMVSAPVCGNGVAGLSTKTCPRRKTEKSSKILTKLQMHPTSPSLLVHDFVEDRMNLQVGSFPDMKGHDVNKKAVSARLFVRL
jgi:hypothetical protein